MPEGLEVELYRRAASRTIGRKIATIWADERRADPGLSALVGCRVRVVERIGKLLFYETSGPTLGVHFGMTGRIVVDGRAPIERLEYGSARDDEQWDRLVITFEDRSTNGRSLRVNDPRRWSRFELDPDRSRLGPDVGTLGRGELAEILRGRRAVKAVLLDQSMVAGLGNLCVDEVLFHAAVAPTAPASSLGTDQVAAIEAALREELPAMLERGGSHTGVISPAVRSALPACPLDGGPLRRDRVGGRTTVWCPVHQVGS